MFLITEDSYHYYGLFLNGMMQVLEDGRVLNIRREEATGTKLILNLFNQFSSRDALDADLYDVEKEDNLVYYAEKAEREIVNDQPVFKNIRIVLTFNEASKHLADKVVKRLYEEKIDITDIDVKVVKTFISDSDEVVETVKKWTGLVFNPNTCEYTDSQEELATCSYSQQETIADNESDELPF